MLRPRRNYSWRQIQLVALFQILEVNPKTPSEALAKELRQTRLTVDRLECEKKELEHKVSSQAGGR